VIPPATPTGHGEAPLGEQVAVLASFGRDASVIDATLGASGVTCRAVHDVAALTDCVRLGLGAIVLTAESVSAADEDVLMASLAAQPSWSDIPLVLLLPSGHEDEQGAGSRLAPLRGARNRVALQRPVPAITLVTTVQSALSARRRQYELRDLLESERAARVQAETANRVKDDFLASVSHELRTPLSSILLWAHLLGGGRLAAEQGKRAVQGIIRSAEAQSRLIEDLLDVTRMLAGKVRLELAEQEIAPVLLAAADVVRPIADAKGVLLEVQLPPSSDRVLLDAERAQQIVWNLLSNAVKFTPAGATVSLRLVPEPRHVRVEVTDSGEGIEPALLPHVFERFRQGDPSARRRTGGLGLGLTIVQQLVQLHGGTVEAASAGKGHGATFTVRLPRVRGGSERPGVAPEAELEATLTGVRVLLVEDEPDIREALTSLLRQAGAEVIAVESAPAALEVLDASTPETRPDVLLSDLAMPGQSGTDLVRALRASEARTGAPPLPALAITAYAREEDRRAALQAGFQLHVSKPVSSRALQLAICTLLDIE